MQRRRFIHHSGLAGVLAAGAAPAIVHAQANLRWRLASSFPKSLDTIFGAAELFAKKVGEMTGGKFQISVHPAGELLPPFGVVDGVQAATVEIVVEISHHLTERLLGVFVKIAYGDTRCEQSIVGVSGGIRCRNFCCEVIQFAGSYAIVNAFNHLHSDFDRIDNRIQPVAQFAYTGSDFIKLDALLASISF